jgi:AraC family transcriptional regulator of arabinose operon
MDPRIARVVAEIERDVSRRATLPGLAAAVSLSPSRFALLFHQEVGMSPGRYIRARRLDRARALLETTALSVREVMTSVGMSDPGRFARDFRNHYGMRPLEWRAATEEARRRSRRLDDSQQLARLLDDILELL